MELLIFGGKFVCLIVERKFALFALFYFVLRAISKYKPPLEGGEGLIFGEAYIWRGFSY